MSVAYRPQQITIDVIKPNTPPMISILIQRLELDENNEILSMCDQSDRVYRNGLKILTETIEFIDPVTGLSGTISIAGVQQILGILANKWTANDFDCETDNDTGWATNCEVT
jgi:hypothetical protein